jgi:hypothetical protein
MMVEDQVVKLFVLQHLTEEPLNEGKYLERHQWHFETLQQCKLWSQLISQSQ